MKFYNKYPGLIRVLFFALLVVLAYANSFHHQYNLDDFLVRNAVPAAEDGWRGIFGVFQQAFNKIDYRPLSVFTFALENYFQGKLVPETSHVINALLYLLCALVLYACIRKLPVKNSSLLALVTTAIFIVHPIHSNVVSSLKNRDIIISLIFGLASVYFILEFIKYNHADLRKKIAVRSSLLLGSMLLILIGTMAKLDIVSFVILIPLTLIVFSPRKRLMPFIYGIAAMIFGLVTYKAFRFFRLSVITPRYLETTTEEQSILITENAMVLQNGLIAKIQAGLVSTFYYLKFHLIPTGYYYYFGYDMIPVDELFIWQNIVAAIALVISLIAFIYFFKRKPEISWGIGMFYGGLMYCLNIYTPIAGIVAPRLAFIASVGFCIVLAASLIGIGGYAASKIKSDRWDLHNTTLVLMLAVVIIYLPFTVHRNKAWKDKLTLIATDIDKLDRSFEGQRIACMSYLDASKWVSDDATAIDYINKTIKSCETASSIYDMNQFVEETIGLAYFLLRDYNTAQEQFRAVLEKFDTSELALEHLGDIMRVNGQLENASEYYKELVKIAPDYYMGYFKFTQVVQQAGVYDLGIEQHKIYTKIYPQYHFPYEGLGFLYLNKGDTISATNCFFYALDKGGPNQQYVTAMEDYYRRHGLKDEWNRLLAGERMDLYANE